MEKRYRIVCYAKVEPEEIEKFLTLEEAQAEKEQGELMQPENKYEIEEVN